MSNPIATPRPFVIPSSTQEKDLETTVQDLERYVNHAADLIEVKTRLLEGACASGLRVNLSKFRKAASEPDNVVAIHAKVRR